MTKRDPPFSWRPTAEFKKLVKRLGYADKKGEDMIHGAKSQTIDRAIEIANARLDELEVRATGISNAELIMLYKLRGLSK